MGVFFVVMLCMITAGILIFGLITFMRGGEFNQKYGNKIMRARLGAQFIAVVAIILVAWLAKG